MESKKQTAKQNEKQVKEDLKGPRESGNGAALGVAHPVMLH